MLYLHNDIFMAALRIRCGHSILPLWFLSFFLAYSQRSRIGYLRCFHAWCGLSANLKAGLKCAARGSLKIQDAKNRHLHSIEQLCRAISLQIRHESTIGETS